MIKWMSLRTKPAIVTACGLVALSVVTLCWATQAQARVRSYELGSRDAFMAARFDPFLLTATPLSDGRSPEASVSPVPTAPVVRGAVPEASVSPAPTAPVVRGAVPGSFVAHGAPPVRVPHRPPVRSPRRPPI